MILRHRVYATPTGSLSIETGSARTPKTSANAVDLTKFLHSSYYQAS